MVSLLTVEETAILINDGANLLVAGDEKLLRALPPGKWIGGTIPYFMSDNGGIMTRTALFVTVLPPGVTHTRSIFYSLETLSELVADEPTNGFSFIIIPAFSQIHLSFAERIHSIKGIFNRPLSGWVSGVGLDEAPGITPKVVDGESGVWAEDKALVLHAELKPGLHASIGIINFFKPGNGETITFDKPGFSTHEARIDGRQGDFARWLDEKQIPGSLPLVGDHGGTLVNVSIQSVNTATSEVRFYGPVFPGIEYRFATPVDDYVSAFTREIERISVNPVIAVNCILNYFYGDLEGRTMGGLKGPMTFGEIAHVLFNQTLVYLELKGAL